MEEKELVERLKESRYGGTPTEILEFSTAAAGLHASMNSVKKKEWLKQNGLHADTWAKVVAVGTATKLHDPKLITRLPGSLSTLSLLARLTEIELERAENEGLITPDLSYRQLATWRKANSDVQSSSNPLSKLVPILVAIDQSGSGMEELIILGAIQEALDKISVRGQLISLNNWDRIEAQVEKQWQRGVIEDGISEVNNLMGEHLLTIEDLSKTTRSLQAGKLYDEDDIKHIYALKMAYNCVYLESKQGRYQSRKRLVRLAKNGNPTAIKLTHNLLGVFG